MAQPYTTIIGLEVHVQLATASKLFCGCSTKFGGEPNTQTCPVCMGLPGTLPVMNREALRLAHKTALALGCEVPEFTKWDRKQYYYPDLPKGYQISQYDLPMSQYGRVEVRDPQDRFEPVSVRILRAHLEEDAGKSLHDEVAGRADSVIDLNRTGTPLLEIVTEPDLRTAAQAKAFLEELRLLLTYIEVSDCNMQEGSLRMDANVNVHVETPAGKVATPIVEIKNLNSFRAVERAIEYEAERQFREWQETGRRLGEAPKQTRGWDDTSGKTKAQRSKEESSDYRYFPDPDLVPVCVTEQELTEVRASLGELPQAVRARLTGDFGLSAYDAGVLVAQGLPVVRYFLDVANRAGDAKGACNWVTQDVLRVLKQREVPISQFPIAATVLGDLVGAIRSGALPSARGRNVFDALLAGAAGVSAAMELLGIAAVDDSQLVDLCRSLLASNPRVVVDVQQGRQQAIGALIGQAKKQNPNADPSRVRELCLELIASMPPQ